MKRAICVLIGLMLCGAAWAQSAPPYGTFSTLRSGTITSSPLFSLLMTSTVNGVRKACLIQNQYSGTATHIMYVANTSTAPVSTSTAWQIPSLGSFSCALQGGGVVLDNIYIAGTAGDPYAYASQP